MLLKQLNYFVNVVDCHSFTKAAEQCYISQSAISQQIRSLEEELGVSLLIRKNRSFTLTNAGEYFYRHGKELLKDFDHLKEETIKRGDEDDLSLKIGYLKGYEANELYEAVKQFSDLYPEISISMISGTHEELYNDLINNDVHLKISDQRRAFNEDYYNYILKVADCYVEISNKNPLSQKEILTLDDLKRTSCILISSKSQQAAEKDFYQNTLRFPNTFLFADTLESARLMVVNNRGFMPIDAIGRLNPPSAGIKRIPLYHNGKPLQRKFCAFWSKERTNYYIEEFAKLLKDLLNPNLV